MSISQSTKTSPLAIVATLVVMSLAAVSPSHAKGLDDKASSAITSWLNVDDGQRGAVPADVASLAPLSKQQVEIVRGQLWETLRQTKKSSEVVLPAPTAIGDNKQVQLRPRELKTGEKSMPFVFIERGQPAKSKPMFICLHGGGGAKVSTPHGWAVNTREWHTQIKLAANYYPDNAIYFVPRMADDRDGRWYYSYCQDAYDQVVREAILHHNVDPNRIYLIGISEGAYTAFRLGAFMADRWAGAGSMAGGEPLGNAPPENMRNLAFRADIGEKDTMFDRIGLNRRYGEALEKLNSEDAQGYRHKIEVHAGRGHGIDYRPCPKWLFQHKRNPWPTRVRWVNISVHGRRRLQSYWLAVDTPPTGRVEFDAQADRKSNSVTVQVLRREKKNATPDNSIGFRVYLNDHLLDLDKPIRIVRNGTEVFSGNVSRRVDTLLQSLAERSDVNLSFPAEIRIPAAAGRTDAR